jgi:hypothetical protein
VNAKKEEVGEAKGCQVAKRRRKKLCDSRRYVQVASIAHLVLSGEERKARERQKISKCARSKKREGRYGP